MKAFAYEAAHPISQFAITERELPEPELRPHDILVEVKAFAVNPVDFKIRGSRTAQAGGAVILGWDFAGVVKALGPEAKGFKVGDEVYGAGDLTRQGSYAERLAVDARICALKPKSLSFGEAAALPLTSLTAWEALLERPVHPWGPKSKAMIIGGAGGVGSLAIQLLKAKTQAFVIATASRSETQAWCRELGADLVIDHRKPLVDQLKAAGHADIDVVFSTNSSDTYFKQLPEVIKPFGAFVLIDDPASLDVISFKRKSISIQWELMFTKTLYQHNLESQGQILKEIAGLIDSKKLRSSVQKLVKGPTVATLQEAHESLESGTLQGKLVFER